MISGHSADISGSELGHIVDYSLYSSDQKVEACISDHSSFHSSVESDFPWACTWEIYEDFEKSQLPAN